LNITYESKGDILHVQFCGLLNSIDMIFLYLNEDYNSQQQQHGKILYDFTQITGSQLSKEDAQGLAILRKRDKSQTSKKHLVIVPSKFDSAPMADEFAKVISGGNYRVDICTSLVEAEDLLAD
jgi:hypothetical protein